MRVKGKCGFRIHQHPILESRGSKDDAIADMHVLVDDSLYDRRYSSIQTEQEDIEVPIGMGFVYDEISRKLLCMSHQKECSHLLAIRKYNLFISTAIKLP